MNRHRVWPTALCGTAVLFSLGGALAASPKPESKTAAPKLEIPKLAPIPKAEGAVASQPEPTTSTLKTVGASAQYSVVSVRHLKNGSNSAHLGEVAISGSPPSTEPFRTVVRIKCAQRVGAPIEVVILDPRGDTVMTASGQFHFAAGKKTGDETDYSVDWDVTPWPHGGAFQVLVRVAGQPMGTWPLKVNGPA